MWRYHTQAMSNGAARSLPALPSLAASGSQNISYLLIAFLRTGPAYKLGKSSTRARKSSSVLASWIKFKQDLWLSVIFYLTLQNMQIIVHYELESEPSVVHVEHYLCSAQRVVKAISCDHPSEDSFILYSHCSQCLRAIFLHLYMK